MGLGPQEEALLPRFLSGLTRCRSSGAGCGWSACEQGLRFKGAGEVVAETWATPEGSVWPWGMVRILVLEEGSGGGAAEGCSPSLWVTVHPRGRSRRRPKPAGSGPGSPASESSG